MSWGPSGTSAPRFLPARCADFPRGCRIPRSPHRRGDALAFDFTNGFHDTATRWPPRSPPARWGPGSRWPSSAVLNLVGAFLSVRSPRRSPRASSTDGAQRAGDTLVIIFAGLVGGILWNLLTWLLGLPSSSSHALFGGLIGAAIAALGVGGRSALSSTAWSASRSSRRALAARRCPGRGDRHLAGVPVTRRVRTPAESGGFRWGQIGAASLLVARARHQRRAEDDGHHHPRADRLRQWTAPRAIPLWVKVAGAGDRAGHLLRRVADHPHPRQGSGRDRSPQGLAAETSAAIILASSHLGFALSTTRRSRCPGRWPARRTLHPGRRSPCPAGPAVGDEGQGMMPMVFCASLVPWASETREASRSGPTGNPSLGWRRGRPRDAVHQDGADRGDRAGDGRRERAAGSMTLETRPCHS